MDDMDDPAWNRTPTPQSFSPCATAALVQLFTKYNSIARIYSHNGPVGVVTMLWARGSRSRDFVSLCVQRFSSLQRRDQLWDLPSLLQNEYQGLLSGGRHFIAHEIERLINLDIFAELS
jgi:hypothetical protein